MKSLSIFLIVIASSIWMYILVTDTRVLFDEIKIEPGQFFVVEGFGDLGRYNRPSLVCKYFNGRKSLPAVYWYSPNNNMGMDACPFIKKD